MSLEHQYKDTIDLPQTEFPMRGNGPVREPEIQAVWFESKIYEQGLEIREQEKAELFILHDGPPYLSSENIHIGTALNKILKDIVIKFKTQNGFKTPYIPGYDSHGLPIENAVVSEIKGGRNAVSVVELRAKCKDFALKNLKGQEEKFKRLGILGDWSNPYVTLDPQFESEQIKLFAEMANKSYIYRGLKTVFWSYGAETALADAEVEYVEDHVSSAIYVAFKCQPASIKTTYVANDTKVVIWTTTPWTIPGNLAICLNPDIDYVVVALEDEESKPVGNYLVADVLKESFAKNCKLQITKTSPSFKGKELEGLVCVHPLFNRPSPIIFGEHVTTDAGTGCVHTAPGHGQEDFDVGKKYGLQILCPVDGRGVYTKEAGSYQFKNPELLEKLFKRNESVKQKFANLQIADNKINLEGFHVIKQGNDLLVACLGDAGALLSVSKLTHSYPYCWRTKTPLLYRATEQWFASVEGFRQLALSEIDEVKWFPERGRNRIYSMVKERGDWCISRQRTWGVPIPAFYNTAKLNSQGNPEAILDQEIIKHVAKIFAEQGSFGWYSESIEKLVPESFLQKYPDIKIENLKKEQDTMDVWFDSGSTHRAVVAARLSPGGHFSPVDLYLEGSDQHRGWFQSSLLTSVATNGFAPYKAVLTHGFVLDDKGRKMSKSLGNVVDPQDVIKNYGADILRLWVASVDYSTDIKVGDAMFKQLSDIYRNFRNTSRYMLGSLFDFDPARDMVSYDKLWNLDQLMLHRLQKLVASLTSCFEEYQFFKYYQLIQNFCSVDLSAFYFDIIKDRLYTHGTRSLSRRAAQTVIYELLKTLNRLFVPVLPHLAEDILNYTPSPIRDSYLQDEKFFSKFLKQQTILLSNWPKVKQEFINETLSDNWQTILEIRELAYKEIEKLRQDKVVGKSLEAQLSIAAPSDLYNLLFPLLEELKQVFIVSDITLTEAPALSIAASQFTGVKCHRCWKFFHQINERGLCLTCDAALTTKASSF